MTDVALMPDMLGEGQEPPGTPRVQPPWLRPVAIVAIVLAHVAVFVGFMYAGAPKITSLDSISMDLVPEGDFFEQQEVSEAEDTPPPVAVEEPELALPPPMVMSPDAPPLPAKKEDAEKVEKKREERKEVEHAQERREAQARRRYGAPEGHAAGSGASQATCLAHVAAALRRHTPGATSLGPGHASVTFHINAGGGISGISASGSSPAHAALARRIVSSSRGPSSCASAFVSQGFTFH
ncbi:energy transducer TonB [Methylocystis sp. WRRC1]|uniref:energy transducer TonB n=1 Tax=Methylocystis sp. WRRC1 TaxID=1732014 RepID=UPI001D147898|nr:energy transducer TonB [Methylocystis sp. WRRC1]MCC3245558.1 energy transducer TonB [Methylocystis sp. WRRC1]